MKFVIIFFLSGAFCVCVSKPIAQVGFSDGPPALLKQPQRSAISSGQNCSFAQKHIHLKFDLILGSHLQQQGNNNNDGNNANNINTNNVNLASANNNANNVNVIILTPPG